MSGCGNNKSPQDSAEIKRQAAGQWVHILKSVCGLTDEQLNPKIHQPCPKCGGTDRFRAFDNVNETGGLICNQCHSAKNNDGFESIRWLRDCDFRTALQFVSGIIGRSLDVTNHEPTGKPAKVQKTIHATAQDAIAALSWSLKKTGLLPNRKKPNSTWTYHHADGAEAGAVCRWDLPDGRKEIRQISKGSAGWTCSAMAEPRPLWNLPAVIQADEVWICEGEKAAEAAKQIGVAASTPTQGSKSPKLTDWSVLNGKRVVILPDNDEPGEKFARELISLIVQQAANASIERRFPQSIC